jgi:hypothetical protein
MVTLGTFGVYVDLPSVITLDPDGKPDLVWIKSEGGRARKGKRAQQNRFGRSLN